MRTTRFPSSLSRPVSRAGFFPCYRSQSKPPRSAIWSILPTALGKLLNLPHTIGLILVPVLLFTVQSVPGQSTIPRLTDSFSSYANRTGICFADSTTIGRWRMVYNGYGCNKFEPVNGNIVLHLAPKAAVRAAETHACLVLGQSFTGNYSYSVDVTTKDQLRKNSPPNPWEVGWVVWDYSNEGTEKFYYFAPKPNGWELGKRDWAYPGGQHFLTSGTTPTTPIGKARRAKVIQKWEPLPGALTIWVYLDGIQITRFTDRQRPYPGGKIGFYTEDAHVHFDNVAVY